MFKQDLVLNNLQGLMNYNIQLPNNCLMIYYTWNNLIVLKKKSLLNWISTVSPFLETFNCVQMNE